MLEVKINIPDPSVFWKFSSFIENYKKISEILLQVGQYWFYKEISPNQQKQDLMLFLGVTHPDSD